MFLETKFHGTCITSLIFCKGKLGYKSKSKSIYLSIYIHCRNPVDIYKEKSIERFMFFFYLMKLPLHI